MENFKSRKPRTILCLILVIHILIYFFWLKTSQHYLFIICMGQINQMKYPAPYSHSFIRSEPLQNVTNKMKKSTSFQENKQRIFQPPCCWTRPKPLTQGCDPYAPHLKYGVFPRKIARNKNVQMGQTHAESENILMNRNHLIRDKKKIKKGQLSETPLFVIRSIDKSFTRHLSSSGVMHVDIKPLSGGNNLDYNKNMSAKFGSNRFLRNKAY